MFRRLWLATLAVLPIVVSAQRPAIRPAENGAAPGFVLESWTAREGLPVNTISQVMQSRSGYIWLATFDGLVRFDGSRFTTFNVGNSESLPSNRIVDISEASDGALIVTTDRNDRVRFYRDRFTRLKPDSSVPPTAGPTGQHIARGADGTTWTATRDEIRVDGRVAYRTPPGGGFAMTITSIAVDHEGSLWFGTLAGGLHQLKPALFDVYTLSDTRGYNNLYSVVASRSGGVWAGAWFDGVTRIRRDGSAVHHGAELGLSAAIGAIHEDAQSRLWIDDTPCQLPAMLCRRMSSTPFVAGDLVNAIHEDPDGTFWFGTTAGLFRLRDGAWSKVGQDEGAPRSVVRDFLRTTDGALWMATNGSGLARFHDGTFVHITTADGLPSNLIRALHQDKDGWLWIGTEGKGIARLDPRAWFSAPAGRHIANIRASNGLFDDGIHTILEDDSDRLWMSTNRGIFWVARSELNAVADGRSAFVHSVSYTERHGLRSREANGGIQPAATRSQDGRLWFATQEGVAVVDPARIKRGPVPSVVVEKVLAGGTALSLADGDVDVSPDRRDLEVQYTALTFLAPDNVRFRYRLDPYDRDWVDASARRSAVYTRIPPGSYTFRVMANNGDDVWTEGGTALAIRVVPTFVETRAFVVLILIALGLVTWVAMQWRVTRIRTLAATLQQRVDERTAELREREALLAEQNAQMATQADQLRELDVAKTRFFANVSHELRTPLTLTIGPLEDARAELLEAGSVDAVGRVDMALRNARRLHGLVNQILDLTRLDAGRTTLRAMRGDLSGFVRGVASAFDGLAIRKEVDFQMSVPTGDVEIWFDADALEKVLANLLSNAFKFTPRRGRILVTLDAGPTEEFVRVRVSDSGPGIPAAHLPYIFERFHQVDENTLRSQPGTGIGLSLARELAELHGGSLDVASDRSEGATFTLLLRRGRLHLREDQVVSSGMSAGPQADVDHGAILDAALVDADQDPTTQVGEMLAEEMPTILIADDSADMRRYVRSRFQDRYRIVEASDGAEALRLATAVVPDLIISDVMMPGMDGYAMVAALRESSETDFIPVVLLTAQAEQEQKIAGLTRGADEYIAKPFEMRELDARVENLIASRRKLRERFAGAPVDLMVMAAAPSATDRAFIERLQATIADRLGDPDFDVGELAAAMFQDRSHLFRRTRELLGETPSDLLRRVRLERAAVILQQGEGTVAEVAYACGFNSVSNFCRAFKVAYGVTPSAYRPSVTTPHR